MTTAEQVKVERLEDLEKQLVVVGFVRDNVLSLLRKYDGKKITKLISNHLQKQLEGVSDLKIFDISIKKSFMSNTLESGHIIIKYKDESYTIDLNTTRIKLSGLYGYDGKFVYENLEKNVGNKFESLKASIESYKSTDVEFTKDVAEKLDSLYHEYQKLVDSLTYEQKTMVGRDLLHSPKNLTDLKQY